jgi:pSer/pThr/pTyr-binding forkhead associated (FHA) protein
VIATPPDPKVRLEVVRGPHAGERIRVRGPRFVIGRQAGCQLRPSSDLVSRQHAAIEVEGDAVILRDLGSRNGTLCNDRPVSGLIVLEDGDRIGIGPLLFVVSIEPAAARSEPGAESESGPDSGQRWDEVAEPTPDPDAQVDYDALLREMGLAGKDD